jgi:hypothetical protein
VGSALENSQICSRGRFGSNECMGGQAQISPFWAAPEVIQSHVFTEQSDMWSWAMLAMEVYTYGAQPFRRELGGTPLTRRDRIVNGLGEFRPSQPDTCSDGVFALLQRAWHGSPVKRPTFGSLVEACVAMAKTYPADVRHVPSHHLMCLLPRCTLTCLLSSFTLT